MAKSLSALKIAFYGGNLDSAEYQFLQDAYDANLTAADLIGLVSGDNLAVRSEDYTDIVQMTQAAYNGITPDPNTLYVIVG